MATELKTALERLTPAQQDEANEAAGHIRLNDPPEGRQIFPSRFVPVGQAPADLVACHREEQELEREIENKRLALEERKRKAIEIHESHEACVAARDALRSALEALRGNLKAYQTRLAEETIPAVVQHSMHGGNENLQSAWDHTHNAVILTRLIEILSAAIPETEKKLAEQQKRLAAFRKTHGISGE